MEALSTGFPAVTHVEILSGPICIVAGCIVLPFVGRYQVVSPFLEDQNHEISEFNQNDNNNTSRDSA